ncbi:MAG: tyrosine-type recombinase/integrase [Pseudomonadota bacterium]
MPNEYSVRATRLARYTGLRPRDLFVIPPSADKGAWLEWKTSKRGVVALIPITKEIRAELDWFAARRAERRYEPAAIIINSRGKPFTPDGFSSNFQRARRSMIARLRAEELPSDPVEAARRRKWIDDLETKRFYDLRGTAATHYAYAGFDDKEIADFMAWNKDSVEKIINKYVRRERVMRETLSRLSRDKAGT